MTTSAASFTTLSALGGISVGAICTLTSGGCIGKSLMKQRNGAYPPLIQSIVIPDSPRSESSEDNRFENGASHNQEGGPRSA